MEHSNRADHLGMIGFGAVARDVLRVLAERDPALRTTVLLRAGSPSRLFVPPGTAVVDSLADLLAAMPDLVVEMAGQLAVPTTVPAVLEAGVPVLVVSTGAFADRALLDRCTALATSSGTRLLFSAGAVAGLDYLDAAALGEALSVRYTSRKPPAAWRAELHTLGLASDALVTEVILFDGTAEEAARRYPRNLNVAFTLRLRLGPDVPLTVRVVADPGVHHNTHEVEASGSLGVAEMRFANVPSLANPKTSALTGHMVAAEIRRVLVRHQCAGS